MGREQSAGFRIETPESSADQMIDVIKSFEDRRKRGFGWSIDGLGSWSSEQIFAKLHELGIDESPDSFRSGADHARSYEQLSDEWCKRREWDQSDLWQDFPMLAAGELWRRLAPDIPCPELISERLDAVMDAEEAVGPDGLQSEAALREEVAATMAAIDYVESGLPAKRAERYEQLQHCSLYTLSSWFSDFISKHGPGQIDDVVRIAQLLGEVNSDSAAMYQSELAAAYSAAGRSGEALALVRENVERFSDNAWVHLRASDVFYDEDCLPEAVRHCERSLQLARTGDDWDFAADRLNDICLDVDANEQAQINAILSRYPRPPSAVPMSRDADELGWDGGLGGAESAGYEDATNVVPLRAGPKVGRNDPCPCGSGRKYKKCCL